MDYAGTVQLVRQWNCYFARNRKLGGLCKAERIRLSRNSDSKYKDRIHFGLWARLLRFLDKNQRVSDKFLRINSLAGC